MLLVVARVDVGGFEYVGSALAFRQTSSDAQGDAVLPEPEVLPADALPANTWLAKHSRWREISS